MTAKNNKHTVSDIMNTNYHSLKYGVAISTLNNSLEKYRFVPIIDEFNQIKLLAIGDPKREFFYTTHQTSRRLYFDCRGGNNHVSLRERRTHNCSERQWTYYKFIERFILSIWRY